MTDQKQNGDKRAPGVVLVPSEVPEASVGPQDHHVPGKVVVVDPEVPEPLTAKDYREVGYVVDPDLDDNAIPPLVQADRHADLRAVVLADGTQVVGDDIPTASALESRKLAKTPDEVTAEAEVKAEATGEDQVVVDTTPTPVEAIEEVSEKEAKATKPKSEK